MTSAHRTLPLLLCVGCLLAMAVTLCVVVILVASFHGCDGNLSFASYYGDHMVLQKSPERAVLWGFGPEGDEVTVYLSGPATQKTWAKVTGGVWRVTLDPVDAGGPYKVAATSQSGTATLTDVLFGDVWLCGGQSNMYFQTSQIFGASEELALAAKYPHVRPFMVALNMSETERSELIQVELPWFVPTADVLSEFSAVCWLFGRYLYENLKYPIGLVESCWGGTPVEAWSSSRALKQCGLGEPMDRPIDRNSVMWNSMIHPLLNMTIKGAIWYQGERNADYHQDKYSCSFPAMIDDWRMAFHKGSGGQTALDFPFGFVQLSTNQKGSTSDGFPNVRWHQTADTGFVPNARMKRTFMAVALDLPDETSPYGTIHPRDKQDVAYRLTLGARAVAYDENDVPFLGPFPSQILSTETYINITYDQTLLVTVPSFLSGNNTSKDIFELCCQGIGAACGLKSIWFPAQIMHSDPTTVQLSVTPCQNSDEVAAVRYAWKDWPCDFKACPLYSGSGILPAPPFLISRDTGNGRIWKSYSGTGR